MSHAGTIRYWASSRAAAGVDEEQVTAGTLGQALDEARARHPQPRFAEVLGVCSFVVDGRPVGRRSPEDIHLGPGWVAEVLPPFAGG